MTVEGGNKVDRSAPGERRRHFRGSARPGRRIDIRFRERGVDSEPVSAMTRNIGVGGAFIVTDWRAPVGALLELVIAIPGARDDLLVTAEVRWIADGRDDTKGGLGVKFSDLDVASLLVLSEYFATLGTPADSPTPAELE